MKLLIIGTDSKIFRHESQVRIRSIDYGSMFDRYSVVVASSREENKSEYSIGPKNNIDLIGVFDKYKPILFLKTLFKAIKLAKKYDVVSSQDTDALGLIAFVASRLANKKLHIQIHTVPDLNFLTKFIISKADRIRTVSNKIKDMVKPYAKCEIDTLPVFIDAEKYKSTSYNEPNKEFLILAMSRIEKEKNVDTIIRVFDEVSKKHPNAKLVIVGEGKEKESMIRLAIKLKNDRIEFRPWANDVQKYYRSSGLFITLSSFEGYGMTIVESLLTGCPVLTTCVGITDEFIKSGYNSWIVDNPVEVNAVSVLDKILSEPKYYKDVKDNLRLTKFDGIISYGEYKHRLLQTFSI